MPHPRPVERIELSWKNYKLRVIGFVVFLALGVTALAYTFAHFVGQEPGWQTVAVNSGADINCGGDFQLLYELGAGDTSATAEHRTLAALYTQAAQNAYRLFTADEGSEDSANLYDLNHHPNEVLTVAEPLYDALELLARYGDRSVYLAPAYEMYDDLFFCEEDWQAQDFDPYTNEEAAAFYAEVAAFARDSDSVNLELLGEGQVRLDVSEEYLAYAADNGFDRFVDFCWLANAFRADYLADTLRAQGFTHGCLTSFDGFVRNLDSRNSDYTFNLCCRREDAPVIAATLRYSGPMTLVNLRAFPLSAQDETRFYQFSNGEIRHPYLDIADGRCRNAAEELLCVSENLSCAETLLRVLPLYVADSLDTEGLAALAGEGLRSLWVEDTVIRYTGREPDLVNLYQVENGTFTVKSVE